MNERMPPSDRIPCQVIGCRRTAPASKYPPHTIIICGKCWQLAPKWLRNRIRRIERIGRKLSIDWDTVSWQDRDDSPNSAVRRCLILHTQTFARIVQAASNAKVGIG